MMPTVTLQQQTLISIPPYPAVDTKKQYHGTWSPKQKRAYHRAKTGAQVAHILNTPIKHLVLTTSPNAYGRNIANDFQALRKAIQRKYGVLLPYFMVRTNEGYGVLHVLYRSKQFLPQRWLSAQWQRVHSSSYVYIKQPPNDVARYVVAQYVADQGTSYQRCSWSQNWVCKGFVKTWKYILYKTRDWQHQYQNEYGIWTAPIRFNLALTKWNEWLMEQFIKQVALPC